MPFQIMIDRLKTVDNSAASSVAHERTLSLMGGRMGGPVVRFLVVVGAPCSCPARTCSWLRAQACIGAALCKPQRASVIVH